MPTRSKANNLSTRLYIGIVQQASAIIAPCQVQVEIYHVLQNLVQQLTKPKQVVRGADGKIVGVQ